MGVCGSIGAVESVRIAREIIRHGADVRCVMSEDARSIIHPEALRFATGNEVITEISGGVEHITLCGEGGDADILLICPATASTISKVACGVMDTPVTLCTGAALGSRMPVLVVPVMNRSLFDTPAMSVNIERLRSWKVGLLIPEEDEGKLKMPEPDDVVVHILRMLAPGRLTRRRVLVVSGSTEEHIDDVRVVSNISTGRTGLEVAREAYIQGADVEMWIGRTHPEPPFYIRSRRFTDVASLKALCRRRRFDIAVVPAAISDYTPERVKGKIPSREDRITIGLEQTEKVIRRLKRSGCFTVGFKAESGVSPELLVERAIDRMREHNLDMMVANDISRMTGRDTTAHIIDKDGGVSVIRGNRRALAVFLVKRIIERFSG